MPCVSVHDVSAMTLYRRHDRNCFCNFVSLLLVVSGFARRMCHVLALCLLATANCEVLSCPPAVSLCVAFSAMNSVTRYAAQSTSGCSGLAIIPDGVLGDLRLGRSLLFPWDGCMVVGCWCLSLAYGWQLFGHMCCSCLSFFHVSFLQMCRVFVLALGVALIFGCFIPCAF